MGGRTLDALQKNKKKRIGCLVLIILPVLFFLLWYNSASIKTSKENKFRTFLFKSIKNDIEEYRLTNGEYPGSLHNLSQKKHNVTREYVEAGVFEYYRDPSGAVWYTLTCRFSGVLMGAGGKHNLSWSGIQYSNIKEKLPLSPGAEVPPDENGFYSADFH